MIVVSDTGPLRYLLVIKAEQLLPDLFGEILLPPAVVAELRHPNAPALVREWATYLPSWAVERSPTGPIPNLNADPGETEAIALAKELHGALLTDDEQAARIARTLGIPVFGTLGVLQRGHARSQIDITDALDALAKTNYRHTAALFERVVRQAQRMREDLKTE